MCQSAESRTHTDGPAGQYFTVRYTSTLLHGNIFGHGSADSTAAFLKEHGDIAILVGDERQLGLAVANGGQGAICGVANLYPQKMKHIIDRADNDSWINNLVDELCRYPIIPALKFYLALKSGDASWQHVRAPLVALTTEQQNSLRNWIENNS